MEVIINPEFGLMAETINLVCAYVSGVDPAILTADDPDCMPVDEVRRIMELVCGDIDREDRKIQFFFRGYNTHHPHDSRPYLRCVASVLAYSSEAEKGCDLQVCRQALHNARIGLGLSYEITSLSVGLGIACHDEYRCLAEELRKVDMPDELRLSLAVALSTYHEHADMLCDIIEPLALRLKPLLMPWEEKLQSKKEQWYSALHTEEQQTAFVSSRINVGLENLQKLELAPHLFYPRLHSCTFTLNGNACYYRAGLALPLESKDADTLPATDVMALQLLGNMDRLRMLQAMSGRPMQPKELAHELDINRGKVFRDLGNLINSHLVEPVSWDGRPYYTTNTARLDETLERVAQFIKKGREK